MGYNCQACLSGWTANTACNRMHGCRLVYGMNLSVTDIINCMWWDWT
jgi:hypothetical protein